MRSLRPLAWIFLVAALSPLLATSLPLLGTLSGGTPWFPSLAALEATDVRILAAALAMVAAVSGKWVRRMAVLLALLALVGSFRTPSLVSIHEGALHAPIRHAPATRDFNAVRLPAFQTADHPFGTDSSGRDLASRALHGLRNSLVVALAATALATFLGIAVGLLASFGPRAGRSFIDLLAETASIVPALLVILAVRTTTPPSALLLVCLLAGFRIPILAKVASDAATRVRALEFVGAAEGLGVSRARVLWQTVAPHAVAPVLALAGFGVSGAILTEASLGFLGLGLPRTLPSLGTVLEDVRELAPLSPSVILLPGVLLLGVAFASHWSALRETERLERLMKGAE